MNDSYQINTPVLFMIFNRPETTYKAFNAIRKVRPKRLYIASDGPRKQVAGEEKIVEKARSIVSDIDWPCDVYRLYRKENLGCKEAVSGSISWFLENEKAGIILEDDCIPEISFFPYCEELLERYSLDNRVMAISGQNFQHGIKRTKYSYYFSRYPHCWGWATWRRAWVYWDGNLSAWPELKEKYFYPNIAKFDKSFSEYWIGIFDRCHAGMIDSWNYPWIYSCWVQGGLTILPNVNLVSNIGFEPTATHTTSISSSLSCLPTLPIATPLEHPPWILRDGEADLLTEKEIFGIGDVSSPKDPLMKKTRQLLSSLKNCLSNFTNS